MRRIVMMIALALCLSTTVAFGQGMKYINLNNVPPYYLSMDGNAWMTDYNMEGATSTGYHFIKALYYFNNTFEDAKDYLMADFASDTAVTVIGVAFGSNYLYLPPYVDMPKMNESALRDLYDHYVMEIYVPSGEEYDFVTYSARMEYQCWDSNYIKIMHCDLSDGGMDTVTRRFVVEAFFDQPIVLSDTFYAGIAYFDSAITGTNYSHDDTTCHADLRTCVELHFTPGPTPGTDGPVGYYPPYDYPMRHFIYRDKNTHQWGDTSMNAITMIWPIIQLNGDVCDEVGNIEGTQIGGDALYVTWDVGVNHSRWQVSYGPEGTAPGGGTVVETSVPQALLTGLPEGTCEVYVRSYCDLARGKWSPWSEAVSVNIGIQDVPDVPLAVYPNPTKGTFRIEAETTIANVELYDLGGSAVLSLPVNNTGMGIDISALPEGAYILAAHTASGLATRRIVKQ